VSQKSNPLKTCICFHPWLSSTDKNFTSYLLFISSPMYQFLSTYLNICENVNTLCNIKPWILTVYFSLLKYSQTFSEANALHPMKSCSKSVCQWSHVMFKMSSISWHTGLELIVEVLHTFSNGFLQKDKSRSAVVRPSTLELVWVFTAAYGKLPAFLLNMIIERIDVGRIWRQFCPCWWSL